MVKIPATAEGVPAIRQMISRGPQHQRHPDLQPVPLRRGHRGLPVRARGAGGVRAATLSSGAQRGLVLREPGGHRGRPPARQGRRRPGRRAGRARRRSPRPSWPTGCSRSASPVPGGRPWPPRAPIAQRPLWASTSTKNPAYPDLLYVDNLIGPDTVNTMPDATVDAFLDHGTVARTVDATWTRPTPHLDPPPARSASTWTTWPRCSRTKGWPSFAKSFEELLQALHDKANAASAA